MGNRWLTVTLMAVLASCLMVAGCTAAADDGAVDPQPQTQAPQPQTQAPLAAQPDFAAWLDGLRAEALSRGIRPMTLDAALSDVKPIDRVLELDRRQPEFTLTFDEYLSRVVNPQKVEKGRQRLADHRKLLQDVAKRYGVPAAVIVAMWGIESDYGRLTGGYPVVPALATLAYDGRRSQYFRGELMHALEMIDGGVPAERMKGSWAGAMGQCQFMPSTYVKYAQSWLGTERPDIWQIPPDVFASTANYLSQIGWDPHQRWGRAVRLPKRELAPALFGLEVKKSLTEWRTLGIRLPDGKSLPASPLQASLVRAETGKGKDVGKGPPYLVYDNFRVIMKWNRSVFFAIAAGTLSDKLAGR